MKTRLKIHNLITIVLSWPTWIVPTAKQTSFLKHDLPQLAEGLHLPERFCYSQRQKEENRKNVHGKGVSKIKEKVLSHLNLINLVFWHDSSLSLSAAHFFHRLYNRQKNYFFRSMEMVS